MNVACIMDPIESINYEKDTSYFLLLGAHELGHKIYHIDQNDIFLKHKDLYGYCTPIEVLEDQTFRALPKELISIAQMNLVFVRKDPPFDRRYFYTTLLLDHLPSTTKVSNSPQSLRDWNEKLAALEFPEYCPPTLIANSWSAIESFIKDCNSKVVVKPLDGNGGKGILFIHPEDANIKETMAQATKSFSEKIVIQKYVTETKTGDVRVLFVKDTVLGSFIRIAAEGQELNNLDQGGRAEPWTLTPNQEKICKELAPIMHKKGVSFVGIDFLGDYLIEINVTSATGLQELSKFHGKKYHHIVIEELLKDSE